MTKPKTTLICVKTEVASEEIEEKVDKYELVIGEKYEGTYDVRRSISPTLSDLDASIDEGYWILLNKEFVINGNIASYGVPYFFPKELFITLAEWRNKQIEDILI